MGLDKIFNEFANLLETRFSRNILTTEDSIRYTLFASMIANNIQPDEVLLEYPHPSIEGARIDTWLPSFQGKPVAFEFKYDRDRPGPKNKPRTMQAGQVFKDLYRLSLLNDEMDSFFVYVTTKEMHTYYNNPSNEHSEFFNLSPSSQIEISEEYFSKKPPTFMKPFGKPFKAVINSVYHRALPNNHELRIYKVH